MAGSEDFLGAESLAPLPSVPVLARLSLREVSGEVELIETGSRSPSPPPDAGARRRLADRFPRLASSLRSLLERSRPRRLRSRRLGDLVAALRRDLPRREVWERGRSRTAFPRAGGVVNCPHSAGCGPGVTWVAAHRR